MQKTKLGLSVGLVGAAICFLGAYYFLGAVLLAGYVLLCESNEWLRKLAVKVVAIVVAFGLISVLIGALDDIFAIINVCIGWFGFYSISFPLNLDSLLSHICSLVETVLLVLMGIRALTQGAVRVKFFDNLVQKHTEE